MANKNNKLRLESCTVRSKRCKECDLSLVIKDHMKSLMQALDTELKEYNTELITTKCLNTAVMIMYMYLGSYGLNHTRYCDVRNVQDRYKEKDKTLQEFMKFKRKILNKNVKFRYLYYVMMTDHDYIEDGKGSAKSFPGHVYVIEKIPPKKERGNPRYSIYQSFIQKYSFQEYIDKIRKGNNMTYNEMVKLINDMESFYRKGVWDDDDVNFWRRLAYVDTSEYKGHGHKGKIFFCYRTVGLRTCSSRLKAIISAKIRDLRKQPPHTIYNNVTSFFSHDSPQTSEQLLNDLLKLQAKLSS